MFIGAIEKIDDTILKFIGAGTSYDRGHRETFILDDLKASEFKPPYKLRDRLKFLWDYGYLERDRKGVHVYWTLSKNIYEYRK